jgi:subtilisin-like proprotein convertase family protein
VAGIAALLRQQIGAGFTHRTFKHLLARRAEKIDLADATPESGGGWKTNAAGFSHNQNYGWGNCNAYRLWQLGRETAGVTADTITSSSLQVENAAIPDLGSITRTIALFTAGKMEEFELTCEFNSADWGDIEIEVTSPAGTTSRLIRGQSGVNGSGTLVWKYMSLQFWGESGVGTWTLKFKDVVAGDLTTLVDWQTTRHIGDFVPTVPRKPTSLANTGFNSLGKPNLKWSSDSLVETGFHIYRKKTTDLVYVLVGTNAANDVTFTDKAAAGKTAYNYYVKAFNDQGEGGKSNTITVITP